MKNIVIGLLIITLTACNKEATNSKLEIGTYRAAISIKENKEIPFVFKVTSPTTLEIYNAEETITVDEIEYKNDSINIKMPVFSDYLVAKINKDKTLSGFYISPDKDRKVPFSAVFNNVERFTSTLPANQDVTGTWETVFSPGKEEEEYIAKGVFKQIGEKVTGTFSTTTGDYRYLEGIMKGNELMLSTFDGAHAFLFTAKVSNTTLEGYFYSGNHWKEAFVAKRNPNYELPNANELTFLKDGYDNLEFSFPTADGNLVSLNDEQFKNKVVVVQIMGSWCPNCLDESKYYAGYYNKNKSKGIEFIGLAFEVAKAKETAFKRIERLKTKIGINYPILLAQYGGVDKAKAQEKLPMLNHILSYPTSIFIDKAGKVRKIHTGFNGPATGEKYIAFKEDFEGFIEELLNE